MNPYFSIVMAYYNRKHLLYETLRSIEASECKDEAEIIIVDDGSDPEHNLNTVGMDFDLDIRVLRVDPEDKWYVNPCVVYNKGFKEAKGEVVIIQNPECFHLGDVLSLAKELKDTQYFTYHAYSLTEPMNADIKNIDPKHINSFGKSLDQKELPFPIIQRGSNIEGLAGFYNHHTYRAHGYHFCAAIHRKNLEELGGFDERYAKGVGFDDNEFAARVKRMGLEMCFISYPLVLHQNHYAGGNFMNPANNHLISRNYDLFWNVTSFERTWKANQEKGLA